MAAVTSFALATLNALLNSTAAVLMVLGFMAIKRKQTRAAQAAHDRRVRRFVPVPDLVSDAHRPVRRHALRRSRARCACSTSRCSLSHVLLALAVAPMVITTLFLGLRANYERHRRMARCTLPIWAYVSVTGVVVYLMLYHLPR